jgi:PPOX class probable F420-dependent enzyme
MVMIPPDLEHAQYVSLATFRRSGEAVATPVWAAPTNGSFYVFSAGEAGKIKRLRNSDQARIARCDSRGRLQGDWHDARAVIIDEINEARTALAALREKYGWQMWLTDFASRLIGKFEKRAYIKVTLIDAV